MYVASVHEIVSAPTIRPIRRATSGPSGNEIGSRSTGIYAGTACWPFIRSPRTEPPSALVNVRSRGSVSALPALLAGRGLRGPCGRWRRRGRWPVLNAKNRTCGAPPIKHYVQSVAGIVRPSGNASDGKLPRVIAVPMPHDVASKGHARPAGVPSWETRRLGIAPSPAVQGIQLRTAG